MYITSSIWNGSTGGKAYLTSDFLKGTETYGNPLSTASDWAKTFHEDRDFWLFKVQSDYKLDQPNSKCLLQPAPLAAAGIPNESPFADVDACGDSLTNCKFFMFS